MIKRAVFMVCLLPAAPLCAEAEKLDWGRIEIPDDPKLSHRRIVTVDARPADEVLMLPAPFPHIVRARVADGEGDVPNFLKWSFNKDASEIRLLLGDAGDGKRIELHTAETSGRQPDGTIVFSALDAKVIGVKAALETHPGNHRIGFWVNGEDYVAWDLEIGDAAGKYDVELVYSRSGKAGAEASVRVGESILPVTLGTTSSWYVYQVQRIGEVEVGEQGTLRVEVKSTKQIGPVMNLKAVLLIPKAE